MPPLPTMVEASFEKFGLDARQAVVTKGNSDAADRLVTNWARPMARGLGRLGVDLVSTVSPG